MGRGQHLDGCVMKRATATKYNQACADERRSDRLTQPIKSEGMRIGRHKGMHTHIDEEVALIGLFWGGQNGTRTAREGPK
jgi:hypothetical protein